MTRNAYDIDLDRNPANFQAMTPLSFLERAASVYPEHIAVIHGKMRRSYRELYARARQLASALAARGVGVGDTVSLMLPNTPEMLEAHYALPMTGAVIHAINTRLDAAQIAFQLDHAESKVLITDREFASVMVQALSLAKTKPLLIDVDDREFPQTGQLLGALGYEAFVSSGDAGFAWRRPADEWEAIALGYTSGTTGNRSRITAEQR